MEEITNVQEPENTVKTKKKKIKLDRAEKFMVFAVVVAQGIVPFATSLLNMLFTFCKSGMTEWVKKGLAYEEFNFIYNVFSSLTHSIYSMITSVLSIIVVILIAYLAYRKSKKLKSAAAFLGVYFVVQSISQVFIENPVSYVLNFIMTALNSLAYAMLPSGLDPISYNVVTVTTEFFSSSMQFIVDFVCLILMAVFAVAGLRIINGKLKIKLKRKKKKGETEETTEEIQENA